MRASIGPADPLAGGLNGTDCRHRGRRAELQAPSLRRDQHDRSTGPSPGGTGRNRHAWTRLAGSPPQDRLVASPRSPEAARPASVSHLARAAKHRNARGRDAQERAAGALEGHLHLRGATASLLVHAVSDDAHGLRHRHQRALRAISEGAAHRRDARSGLQTISSPGRTASRPSMASSSPGGMRSDASAAFATRKARTCSSMRCCSSCPTILSGPR